MADPMMKAAQQFGEQFAEEQKEKVRALSKSLIIEIFSLPST